MEEELSLLDYCILCKAKCCKIGKLIGSPILSKKEALKIKRISSKKLKNIKEVVSPSKKKYYTLTEQKNGRCFFLTEENKCEIQHIKPLDCLCYPIKAIYEGDSVKFIIDTNCPTAKHLDKKFIKNAKIIALKSIKRFDKQTYQHWLDTYIGWVKKTGAELSRF